MSEMTLAVTHASSRIGLDQTHRAVDACARQMTEHVAPAWGRVPPRIVWCGSGTPPPGADHLIIQDQPDQPGLAGYHWPGADGRPRLRVFAEPIWLHGGEALSSSLSVSSVLSHEICEWFVNRLLDLWVDCPGFQCALEICDPVAEETYDIDGVSVSDFVYRTFFDPSATRVRFDRLGRVRQALTPLHGGYLQVRRDGRPGIVRGRIPEAAAQTPETAASCGWEGLIERAPAKAGGVRGAA